MGWRFVRRIDDRQLASQYLRRHKEPQLHIGCGSHILDGWLNADLHPRNQDVLRLDATRRFPFRGATFVRIYSEHLIEHLSFPQASAMLRECFRVLCPGGKVRISTPDLCFLFGLHERGEGNSTAERPPHIAECPPSAELAALRERYIEWASAEANLPGKASGFVINHFVRAWGHLFIYDEPILRGLLEQSGFTGVVRRCLNESDDPAFRNLANEGRMPDGFLRLESFTLEAAKPLDAASGTVS